MEKILYPFCPKYHPKICNQNTIIEIEDCPRIKKLGYFSCLFSRTLIAHGEEFSDTLKGNKVRMGIDGD